MDQHRDGTAQSHRIVSFRAERVAHNVSVVASKRRRIGVARFDGEADGEAFIYRWMDVQTCRVVVVAT